MTHRARSYIATIVAIGAALLLLSATSWQAVDGERWTTCLAIAALASILKIRLLGMQTSLSANFVVLLASLPTMPLGPALAIATVATVIHCLWRPRTRPKAIQVVFSVATVSISLSLAYAVVHRAGIAEIPALVLAAGVYFFVNSMLVCGILSLLSAEPLFELWRRCHLWAAPYYASGALLAGTIVASERLYGWKQSLVVYPILFLIYCYCESRMKERGESSLPRMGPAHATSPVIDAKMAPRAS